MKRRPNVILAGIIKEKTNKFPKMTVKELRDALVGVPDDMPVVVDVGDEWPNVPTRSYAACFFGIVSKSGENDVFIIDAAERLQESI